MRRRGIIDWATLFAAGTLLSSCGPVGDAGEVDEAPSQLASTNGLTMINGLTVTNGLTMTNGFTGVDLQHRRLPEVDHHPRELTRSRVAAGRCRPDNGFLVHEQQFRRLVAYEPTVLAYFDIPKLAAFMLHVDTGGHHDHVALEVWGADILLGGAAGQSGRRLHAGG